MRIAGPTGLRIGAAFRDACGMGLCLFFTLSAYLITTLLLVERERGGPLSVRRFYVRRALRIWPLYFVGITIGIVLALLFHRKADVIGFVWYLLIAGNVYCSLFGGPHNPMMPLWSISIEEQFYLLWPWAMRFLSRNALVLSALVFCAIANLTLYIFGQHHADLGSTVWGSTFVQFQMFATGIILALCRKKFTRSHPGYGLALSFAGFGLWFVACYTLHIRPPAGTEAARNGLVLILGYGLISLGCAAVLYGFCLMGPSFTPRFACTLGRTSYGLYVFHVLAIEIVTSLMNPQYGWAFLAVAVALSFALTVLLAAASYKYIESPFLRIKRHFEVLHTRPI